MLISTAGDDPPGTKPSEKESKAVKNKLTAGFTFRGLGLKCDPDESWRSQTCQSLLQLM